MSNTEWIADALCSQVDPRVWHPEVGESVRPAQRICQKCPVRQACLDYAIAEDLKHGVFGGLSANQRAQLKRKAS